MNFNFSCFSLRKRVRRTISAWRNRSSVGQALSVQLAHVETPQHKRVEIVGIENAFMVFPVDILFHNNAPFGRPLRPYYQSITFPFHIGISEIKQPPFFRFGSPSLTFRLYYMRRRELCQLFCEKNLKIFQKIFSLSQFYHFMKIFFIFLANFRVLFTKYNISIFRRAFKMLKIFTNFHKIFHEKFYEKRRLSICRFPFPFECFFICGRRHAVSFFKQRGKII